MTMTRADRDDLIRIAKLRARQAKAEAKTREKVLLAQAEELMSAEFSAQDELWDKAVQLAEEAAHRANQVVADRCIELGIPADKLPRLELSWSGRHGSFASASRRSAHHHRGAHHRGVGNSHT